MHLLQAGGLWGNLSILINAIKLNTRVDLAQKKPRVFSKVIPYPYLKTLYNNHVENQRGKVAGSMFKTCFHCNHAYNPVLSK